MGFGRLLQRKYGVELGAQQAFAGKLRDRLHHGVIGFYGQILQPYAIVLGGGLSCRWGRTTADPHATARFVHLNGVAADSGPLYPLSSAGITGTRRQPDHPVDSFLYWVIGAST